MKCPVLDMPCYPLNVSWEDRAAPGSDLSARETAGEGAKGVILCPFSFCSFPGLIMRCSARTKVTRSTSKAKGRFSASLLCIRCGPRRRRSRPKISGGPQSFVLQENRDSDY